MILGSFPLSVRSGYRLVQGPDIPGLGTIIVGVEDDAEFKDTGRVKKKGVVGDVRFRTVEKNRLRQQSFRFHGVVPHEAKRPIRVIVDRDPALPVFIVAGLDGEEAGDKKAGEIGVGHLFELAADIVEGNDLNPAAHVLQGDHQTDEIAIAGKQDDAVEVAGLEQGVNGQVHIGVGLGGEDPFVIDIMLHIFFDDLEPALAQDVVVAVQFLAVFMVILRVRLMGRGLCGK